MATSNQSSARFRSATEFPKTVESLEPFEANAVYEEMRDCLIFTNRSRAQLLRRNEEHKQSALKLKTDVQRLQSLINQLKLEKQQQAQGQQQLISNLESEILSMTTHLDQLSDAFNAVADIETETQTQWSFMSLPRRFFEFVRAVKAVVLWWRDERGNEEALNSTSPQPLSPEEIEEDRRERPQMYEDQASIGRSLLDR